MQSFDRTAGDNSFRCNSQAMCNSFILGPMLEENLLSYAMSDGAKEGTTIVTLDGPLTLGNMFQLQSELRALKPPCLIIDLTSVPYMDSAGLGVIMNCFVSAQGGGRKLFVTGVNDRVRALLEMTKVDAVLQIYDSVEAAQALA
jgi:anti-anti-sigma factor